MATAMLKRALLTIPVTGVSMARVLGLCPPNTRATSLVDMLPYWPVGGRQKVGSLPTATHQPVLGGLNPITPQS